MKTLIILSVIYISNMGFSQSLEMTIQANKEIYDKYSENDEDTIFITYKIKNPGNESVLLRLAREFFDASYIEDKEFGWSHCFSIYPNNYYRYINKGYGHNSEDFIWVYAGEEITRTEPFDISWLCRNAPPKGSWKFSITFNGNFKQEDNYVLYKSDYSDTYSKEFIDGWEGTLKSNSIEITIKD